MREHARAVNRNGRALIAIAVMIVVMATTPARADELEDIDRAINATRDQVEDVRSLYVGKIQLDLHSRIESRLQEGQLLLELGDPDRASVVFLDIVEREDWKGEPGYASAHYLLARSLFEANNLHTAKDWLYRTFEDGAAEDHQAAATLLIEISIKQKNRLTPRQWQELDEVYARLERNSSSQQPELLYARGKGLYAQERYEEAVRAFGSIDPSTPTGLAARYFSGVTRIRLNQPVDALADFQAVIDSQEGLESTPTIIDIIEQAHIAKARVLYKQEKWLEAIDAYQYVPRNSTHFDQVLFEITWAHIAQDDHEGALRYIDILLLSRPDSVFMPDAKRLRADLLKQIKDYDKARETYEELLEDFEPVVLELNQMVLGQADPRTHFQQLVAKDDEGKGNYLPPAVSNWISPDARMNEASLMVGSLGQGRENIEESKTMIAEIEAAITSDNRYQFFPTLREAWLSTLTLENKLLRLRRDLNEIEARQHLDAAAPADRQRFESARDERAVAERAFAKLPQDRGAFLKRQKKVRARTEAQQLRAYRLRTLLDGVEAQVEAMERWLVLQQSEGMMPVNDEMRLRAVLVEARAEHESLSTALQEAEQQLRVQETLGGLDAGLAEKESELRKAYKLALLRERDALTPMRKAASDERVLKARAEIEHVSDEIDRLRAQLTAGLDERITDIKRRLRVERENIARYDEDHDVLDDDVQFVAGTIAYQHWLDAKRIFTDLVLAADIGSVDVVWLEKESASLKLEKMIEERDKEVEILKQDFEQVFKHSEDANKDPETSSKTPPASEKNP